MAWQGYVKVQEVAQALCCLSASTYYCLFPCSWRMCRIIYRYIVCHLRGSIEITYAQALFKGSKILLLDEPTNDLDPDRQQAVKESLIQNRPKGQTILCITHDLSTIQDADMILFFEKSKDGACVCRSILQFFGGGVTHRPYDGTAHTEMTYISSVSVMQESQPSRPKAHMKNW